MEKVITKIFVAAVLITTGGKLGKIALDDYSKIAQSKLPK